MGISVFPTPSAASKTAFRTTLTSGTSWTVPTGVTYVNVTLYGGGGGAGGVGNNGTGAQAGTGGTTTFTGATSATGGLGGKKFDRGVSDTGINATVNSGQSGIGAMYATNSDNSQFFGMIGEAGNFISSIVNTTPGASITYAIGAGGTAGPGDRATGGVGGSGKIDIEYWA
jgi:hypothetical protein